MYSFSEEVNNIINSSAGVILYNGKKVLFKENTDLLKEGLGIVLEGYHLRT
ncbi:MAG: hypothetical protein KatS3mg002_0651 [Candidatus Woesearchaeota archaeon]|nr:MAG: hypothetical protein KatS3mg002_0651 [Candidatus Woesearchaeota archaeon]